MSNFDLTFYKLYIYAKGWSGINLGASHESCIHPSTYLIAIQIWENVCLDKNVVKIEHPTLNHISDLA